VVAKDVIRQLKESSKKRRKVKSGMRKKEKAKVISPISFGSTFRFIENREPQPRDMLIRQGKDFSMPVSSNMNVECRTQASERHHEHFTQGSQYCMTQKSMSRRSQGEK